MPIIHRRSGNPEGSGASISNEDDQHHAEQPAQHSENLIKKGQETAGRLYGLLRDKTKSAYQTLTGGAQIIEQGAQEANTEERQVQHQRPSIDQDSGERTVLFTTSRDRIHELMAEQNKTQEEAEEVVIQEYINRLSHMSPNLRETTLKSDFATDQQYLVDRIRQGLQEAAPQHIQFREELIPEIAEDLVQAVNSSRTDANASSTTLGEVLLRELQRYNHAVQRLDQVDPKQIRQIVESFNLDASWSVEPGTYQFTNRDTSTLLNITIDQFPFIKVYDDESPVNDFPTADELRASLSRPETAAQLDVEQISNQLLAEVKNPATTDTLGTILLRIMQRQRPDINSLVEVDQRIVEQIVDRFHNNAPKKYDSNNDPDMPPFLKYRQPSTQTILDQPASAFRADTQTPNSTANPTGPETPVTVDDPTKHPGGADTGLDGVAGPSSSNPALGGEMPTNNNPMVIGAEVVINNDDEQQNQPSVAEQAKEAMYQRIESKYDTRSMAGQKAHEVIENTKRLNLNEQEVHDVIDNQVTAAAQEYCRNYPTRELPVKMAEFFRGCSPALQVIEVRARHNLIQQHILEVRNRNRTQPIEEFRTAELRRWGNNDGMWNNAVIQVIDEIAAHEAQRPTPPAPPPQRPQTPPPPQTPPGPAPVRRTPPPQSPDNHGHPPQRPDHNNPPDTQEHLAPGDRPVEAGVWKFIIFVENDRHEVRKIVRRVTLNPGSTENTIKDQLEQLKFDIPSNEHVIHIDPQQETPRLETPFGQRREVARARIDQLTHGRGEAAAKSEFVRETADYLFRHSTPSEYGVAVQRFVGNTAEELDLKDRILAALSEREGTRIRTTNQNENALGRAGVHYESVSYRDPMTGRMGSRVEAVNSWGDPIDPQVPVPERRVKQKKEKLSRQQENVQLTQQLALARSEMREQQEQTNQQLETMRHQMEEAQRRQAEEMRQMQGKMDQMMHMMQQMTQNQPTPANADTTTARMTPELIAQAEMARRSAQENAARDTQLAQQAAEITALRRQLADAHAQQRTQAPEPPPQVAEAPTEIHVQSDAIEPVDLDNDPEFQALPTEDQQYIRNILDKTTAPADESISYLSSITAAIYDEQPRRKEAVKKYLTKLLTSNDPKVNKSDLQYLLLEIARKERIRKHLIPTELRLLGLDPKHSELAQKLYKILLAHSPNPPQGSTRDWEYLQRTGPAEFAELSNQSLHKIYNAIPNIAGNVEFDTFRAEVARLRHQKEAESKQATNNQAESVTTVTPEKTEDRRQQKKYIETILA